MLLKKDPKGDPTFRQRRKEKKKETLAKRKQKRR
jgi:hypothetical protein